MRRVYQLILRLHPVRFRQRFEAEMLAVFDDAAQTEGPFYLIADGLESLLRQAVFRSYGTRHTTQGQVEGLSTTGSLFVARQPPPMSFHRLLLGAAISFNLFVIAYAFIGQGGLVSAHRNHADVRATGPAQGLNPSDLVIVSDECAQRVGAGRQTEPMQDSATFHSPRPNFPGRVNELPFPSGRFGIGQISYSFSSSGALARNAANDQFKLLIWYPATVDPNTSVPVDNVWQYSKSAGKFVESHTVVNAGMAYGDEKYPLLLFIPASGNGGAAYLSQIENLVSHGYVVACLQGAEASNEIPFEDARLMDYEADMRRAFFFPGPKTAKAISARAGAFEQSREAAECEKLRFSLYQMIFLATDRSQHAPFVGRIDLDHIGAFGHASGGNAVANLCASAVHISACLDEDGWTANGLLAQEQPSELPHHPFLWISLPFKAPRQDALAYAHMSSAEFRHSVRLAAAASDRDLRSFAGPAYKVSLLARDLMDDNFTDGPLVWSMKQGRIEDKEAPAALAIINIYSRQFFDKYLKNESAPLLDSAGASAFPAINIQRYGAQ